MSKSSSVGLAVGSTIFVVLVVVVGAYFFLNKSGAPEGTEEMSSESDIVSEESTSESRFTYNLSGEYTGSDTGASNAEEETSNVEEENATVQASDEAIIEAIPGVRISSGAGGLYGEPKFPDGSVTLLYPNNGETLNAGHEVLVRWRTENVDADSGRAWLVLRNFGTKNDALPSYVDLSEQWMMNDGYAVVKIPEEALFDSYKMSVVISQVLEDYSDQSGQIIKEPDVSESVWNQTRALVEEEWGTCGDLECAGMIFNTWRIGESDGSQVVSVVYYGLKDDSVFAIKKEAEVHNGVRLGESFDSYMCQKDRGQQYFGTRLCY